MKVIIIGAGRWGAEVAEVLTIQGHELVGWLDDNPEMQGQSLAGKPVLGPVSALDDWNDRSVGVHVAIGNPAVRLAFMRRALSLGHPAVSAVHPQAVVMPSVSLGPGCFVGPCAVLSTNSRAGTAVVVHMGCTIGHDSVLEDGAFFGPGVHTGGGIVVGEGAIICPGAILVAGVKVGSGSIVTAGVVAIRDVPPGHTLGRALSQSFILSKARTDLDGSRAISGPGG